MNKSEGYESVIVQAIETTKTYMKEMTQKIDDRYGKDYARKNPVLLGAAMQVCALDALAAVHVNEISSVGDYLRRLVESIDNLSDSIDWARPDE